LPYNFQIVRALNISHLNYHQPWTHNSLCYYTHINKFFDIPVGLPPTQSQNNSIPLIEGVDPVQVKPYRYPHSRKDQIEKMIADMLKEGIIMMIPYHSCKKKDGTWRFCTNYQALNTISIKDRFPIPTMDELIDELYEAN